MQNSGRSQSPTARRHGTPAGFSYAGDQVEGGWPRHRGTTDSEIQTESAAQRLEGQAGRCSNTACTGRGTRARQSAKTNRRARKRPLTPHPEPPTPSPGSERSSPRGCTGPRRAASSCGRSSSRPGTPGAKKGMWGPAGKDAAPQTSEGRWGRGGWGASLGSLGDRERGPDLAGAAVALLAVLHEAVPAACPGHEDPGVGRVGKARTAPLAEEGAQLAPAAGAEHPREWAPTGGEGRWACWHRHPQPPARLPSPPTSTPCAWPHRPGRNHTA